MNKKVILILCDGMRPDAVAKVNHPYYQKLLTMASYTDNAKTVMPSVTLPCHMSLFHSVEPTRHGVTTNIYTPMVRPVNGLADVIYAEGLKTGAFYSWEELRDLNKSGSYSYTYMKTGYSYGQYASAAAVFADAMKSIEENELDFSFVYNVIPDEVGHEYGWMTTEYFDSINFSFDNIEKLIGKYGTEEYTFIITADHGGHNRIHGEDIPEDMTIPVFILGEGFGPDKKLENMTIMDIAPTICDIMGVKKDRFWEGRSYK